MRPRTRNLIILLISLSLLSVAAQVAHWGPRKPTNKTVFIQAYDPRGTPIKTTVSFPIRATRDPMQPVVTAIGTGLQVTWIDRGVPIRFMIYSPGYEPVGAEFGASASPVMRFGMRPQKD